MLTKLNPKVLSLFALLVSIIFFAVVFPLMALASEAGFPIPEGDVAAILLDLATNYKTMGTIGILSALTVVTVQAVKAFVADSWKYKRLTTLIIAIIYAILSGLVIPGSNAASVVITVFLTSGGAVSLYEALKGAGIIKSKA